MDEKQLEAAYKAYEAKMDDLIIRLLENVFLSPPQPDEKLRLAYNRHKDLVKQDLPIVSLSPLKK